MFHVYVRSNTEFQNNPLGTLHARTPPRGEFTMSPVMCLKILEK